MMKRGADTPRRYSSTSLAATKGKSLCGAGSLSLPPPNVPHSQKLCSIKNIAYSVNFCLQVRVLREDHELNHRGSGSRSLPRSLPPSLILFISFFLSFFLSLSNHENRCLCVAGFRLRSQDTILSQCTD